MRLRAVVVLVGLTGCSLSSEGTGSTEEGFGDSVTVAADSNVSFDSTIEDTTTEDTELPPETGAPDTATPPADTAMPDTAMPDTAMPDTAMPDTAMPPVDMGPPCVETSCGANPTGAKRVGLVDRGVPCPAGFAATNVVESVGGDACSCTCAMNAPPTCPGTGAIPTYYSSTSATCATTGLTLNSAGASACSDMGNAGLSGYFKATPIAPTGGSCMPTVTGNKVAAGRLRTTCEPVTCAGPICAGAPYIECIESSTCSGAFPVARSVGSDVDVTCPACPCSVSATCGGTITFFDDNDCLGPSVTFAANGSCVAVPTSVPASVTSFRYSPALTSAECTPSYKTAAGTRVVSGERKLCCRS